ncbi:hypothetical protein M9Y10_027451 [Tritrichomonas musculus]|uniref:Ral GTPase-activating protein subunit alpha/beta N-terminal domain-containing protein n=1 Tax=Tritrichomonas musculus TaxID=1915356 RepID=A0ABR2H771_9EUKA
MSNESYFFFLPSLFTKGLIKDDGDSYSLVSYPRNVISDSARIIVKDYSTRLNSLDISSKKRIKMITEYLAVALSLPTKDISLMYTAEIIYKGWMDNLSIFGSKELQNRFLRRVFKQLSLPFAFCQPSGNEISDGSFYSLLNKIISDYKLSHMKHGSIFEKETWLILLNVAIGITDQIFEFNLSEVFSKSDSSKICQQLVDLCFSIIHFSGLTDDDVWDNFKTYCLKWNHHLDFVQIWGQYIVALFSNLNLIAYQQKKSLKFNGGIYSSENPIPDNIIKFLFFNTLSLIDVKIIIEDVMLMNNFSQTMSELTMRSENIVSSLDICFLLKRKYPAYTFLKLFGPLLTFLPSLNESYDESISTLISSILKIVSNFEIDHQGDLVKRLISYCVKNASTNHVKTITSFLKRGSFLFCHNSEILPYISQKALQFIQQLFSLGSKGILIGDSLISYLTSIFLSSTEMLQFNPTFKESISNSFNLIWKNSSTLQINYQLLSFAYSYDDFLPVIEKISAIINKISSNELRSFDTAYLSSCILLVGTYVRFASLNFFPDLLSTAAKSLIQSQVIFNLFSMLIKFEYATKIEEFGDLVFSSQQMLMNVIEYTPQIFDIPDNRSVICRFIFFIESLNPKTARNGPLSKQFWNKIYSKNIGPLNDLISYQMAYFIPSKDHFSRRLNSCFEVNENAIINKFDVKDPHISHFSIGQKVLVSFIESNIQSIESKKESYIFVRGQYGKSIFRVRDSSRDAFSGEREPKLSNEIQFTTNSIISEKVDTDNQKVDEKNQKDETEYAFKNDLFTLDIVPNLSIEDLQGIDDNITCDYKDQYETVQDWDKYGFYEPFNKSSLQQIPSASYFIRSMGLMRNNNENEVRVYQDNSSEPTELQPVIRKLDEIDSLPLLPAVIHHILPCDIYDCKGESTNIPINGPISIPNTNFDLNSDSAHFIPHIMPNLNSNLNSNIDSNIISVDDNEYESYNINNADNDIFDYYSNENDYEKFKEQMKFNPQRHSKRMTPALLRFLREIGEPMKISEELHILPPLRSTVPVIPSFHSFIPIISPAMAVEEKDSQTIFNIGETSAMKIIFNETNFYIRPPACEKNLKQFVLAISPKPRESGSDSCSFYNVTQLIVPNGIYSPFTDRQIMTAKTIAFNIANVYEQTIKLNSLLLPTPAQKARKAMSQLAQKDAESPTRSTISELFTYN